MKKTAGKLLACFLILVIFAGFLFFLGWTQFKIKPGHAGILVSKTGGVNPELIQSGSFSWHWEFLVPTNAELKIFELKTYKSEKKYSAKLPSADLYSSIQIGNSSPDFSYSIEYSSRFKIKEDFLISLTQENSLSNQKELESFVLSAVEALYRSLTATFLKKSEQDMFFSPENLSMEELLSLCEVSEKLPYLSFVEFSVKKATFPDYALYNKLRALYVEKAASYNPFVPQNVATEENKPTVEPEKKAEVEQKIETLSDSEKDDLLLKLKQILGS